LGGHTPYTDRGLSPRNQKELSSSQEELKNDAYLWVEKAKAKLLKRRCEKLAAQETEARDIRRWDSDLIPTTKGVRGWTTATKNVQQGTTEKSINKRKGGAGNSQRASPDVQERKTKC